MAKRVKKAKAAIRGNYQSLQSIYDKVTRGLLKQGRKAEDEPGSCVLRNEDGLRCAIGQLVSKAKYSADMEELVPLVSPNNKLARAAGLRTDRQIELVSELQQAHDGVAPHMWPYRFAAIAEQFNLNPVKV